MPTSPNKRRECGHIDDGRSRLIDFQQGGWFPELDADNQPAAAQFDGKPDIYHALQANLFPLVPSLSRLAEGLGELQEDFRALGVN